MGIAEAFCCFQIFKFDIYNKKKRVGRDGDVGEELLVATEAVGKHSACSVSHSSVLFFVSELFSW